MADTKISAMTAASTLGGTELVAGVQSSANVKITIDQIKTWASSSPSLVTPALGTPASGTLTNCTIPVGGVSGLGTGVATFLATPSSANLAAAVTGETGTGALVFADTPTLATPVLGAATGTSVAVTGLLASRSGTATPAAASAVSGVVMGSALVGIYWGTGSPSTAVTAPKGSLYIRTDGSTIADRLYINTDASTAWANFVTSA